MGETKEARDIANQLADVLEEIESVAIETSAGSNSDDEPVLNVIVSDGLNRKASAALPALIGEARELAAQLPTKDDGDGLGPIHPAALKVLEERNFPPRGDTGEYLSVPIIVDAEDSRDTRELRLIKRTY